IIPHGTGVMLSCLISFFFHATATTEIYTLSLHDALPIYDGAAHQAHRPALQRALAGLDLNAVYAAALQVARNVPMAPLSDALFSDRKSTRLNSSHDQISYAVFCLKKKKKIKNKQHAESTH